MQCSLCPKVALYQVRGTGFCRDHKAEGIAAEKEKVREQAVAAARYRIANFQVAPNMSSHGRRSHRNN